jgi:hypothetical protein
MKVLTNDDQAVIALQRHSDKWCTVEKRERTCEEVPAATGYTLESTLSTVSRAESLFKSNSSRDLSTSTP